MERQNLWNGMISVDLIYLLEYLRLTLINFPQLDQETKNTLTTSLVLDSRTVDFYCYNLRKIELDIILQEQAPEYHAVGYAVFEKENQEVNIKAVCQMPDTDDLQGDVQNVARGFFNQIREKALKKDLVKKSYSEEEMQKSSIRIQENHRKIARFREENPDRPLSIGQIFAQI